MEAVNLRTEYMKQPIGIDIACPYLSWNCQDGIKQTAYEVQLSEAGCAAEEEKLIWTSGKVESSQMHLHLPDVLSSKQCYGWKVRLWNENDEAGAWSERAIFETAFLPKDKAACWKAKWINPENPIIEEAYQPASYLRKSFELAAMDDRKKQSARLYITAHGLYVAYINGKRVGCDLLTPGTSQYEKRLQYQTYDVSDYLVEGSNTIEVVLGNGWYRGSNGIAGARNVYGSDIALLCQLEIGKEPVLISDGTWEASQSGPNRSNDLQQGEYYDATMEEIREWHSVTEEDHSTDILVCSNSVPVREQETFAAKQISVPNGETVLDFGQNLSGYTGIRVNAKAGEKIVLTHGEVLDENGNFTIQNFQPGGRSPRNLDQKITYICKEGENDFRPSFATFGFRYVKVETDLPLEDLEITACAVYSQMEQTGWFSCSDEDVNQLVHNALWSQKSNFTDVPTDCPTRERSGFTGDAAAYIPTGLFLMDSYPVFRKWLAELRLAQYEDGTIPSVAPLAEKPEGFSAMMAGSAGWGDGCVIIPYTMWKRTGNTDVLVENYDMMEKWMKRCEALAHKRHKKNEESTNPYIDYVIDSGCHWGEWLEPDIPSDVALRNNLMNGAPEVATAYYYHSAKQMAEISEALNKEEQAKKYSELAENIRKGYNDFVLQGKKVESDRQCEYVRPIAFGLLDEEKEAQAAKDLNDLVTKCGYHLNTGFLSTPYLCKALSDHGYEDTAYRLLLQDSCPSWLYAVKKGATTIWETWDGVKEDGTVHDSMNHYSYGAIVGWLFGSVCGIEVNGDQITIAPHPGTALDHASAVYDSPLGRIESSWKKEKEGCSYRLVIPSNTTARVLLPGKEAVTLLPGVHEF